MPSGPKAPVAAAAAADGCAAGAMAMAAGSAGAAGRKLAVAFANEVLKRCIGPKDPMSDCCNERDAAFCGELFQGMPYAPELCLEMLKYARMEHLFPPSDTCLP